MPPYDSITAMMVTAAALLYFLHLILKLIGYLSARKGKIGLPDAEKPFDSEIQRTPATSDQVNPYQLYQLAGAHTEFFNVAAQPAELVTEQNFMEGVSWFQNPNLPAERVLQFATGDNTIVSCMAFSAMQAREDCKPAWREVLFVIGTLHPYPQYFALQFLAGAAPQESRIVSEVLWRTTHYMDNRVSRNALENFLGQRSPDCKIRKKDLGRLNPDGVAALKRFFDSIDPDIAKPFRNQLSQLRSGMPSQVRGQGDTSPFQPTDNLASVGRFWNENDSSKSSDIVFHAALSDVTSKAHAFLTADRPQSILLKGEIGVGKTSIQKAISSQLFEKGWSIFIASHQEIIAGQVFIGQFEQRLKFVISTLAKRKKVVWYIPEFDQLLTTGKHRQSAISAMDALLPHIAEGRIRVIGEVEPSGYERLIQEKPQISTAMTVFDVEPTQREVTLEIGRRWIGRSYENTTDDVLANALDLAEQFVDTRSAPGNLMDLLRSTDVRLAGTGGEKPSEFTIDDIYTTLALQTGLPLEVIDPNAVLDLDGLQKTLQSRVMGQDRAVECIVERIVLMKAGLTDPNRPIGVFLFAGPTGTGKTEIAKGLSEWLFGSAKNLIRVDMSELQTAESLDRLVGSSELESASSLAHQIRQRPYSVVLLDEFEKAHPNVWDLMLQVFDGARITDRRNRIASFRSAIIIMTSNLGAAIPAGSSIGFLSGQASFDEEAVLATINSVFRRELINRLDRIVVFSPLDRDLMRRIILNEIGKALQRRGLKGRPWAVDWDESAIEFLLQKGFTPDLGARPLNRAIERYVLAPLAKAMVKNQFPEGDQFLFFKCSGDRISVEFVDPAAERPAEQRPRSKKPRAVSLRQMIAHSYGTQDEIEALHLGVERLDYVIGADGWKNDKQDHLDRLKESDFWNSEHRFSVLSSLELVDRVENGLERARKLLERLDNHKAGTVLPLRLISMCSQSIYLLEQASLDVVEHRPSDAFLSVNARDVDKRSEPKAAEFAGKLADMYEAWGRKRNMRMQCLQHVDTFDNKGVYAVYSVAGYGAYRLLIGENGRHVWEQPKKGKRSYDRAIVNVTVAPQPDRPMPEATRTAIAFASEQLECAPVSEVDIVRRYRESPSPLVRDYVRGWQSGKLEQVLGGDFDLMEE